MYYTYLTKSAVIVQQLGKMQKPRVYIHIHMQREASLPQNRLTDFLPRNVTMWSKCTLWHFLGENLLMTELNQPRLRGHESYRIRRNNSKYS